MKEIILSKCEKGGPFLLVVTKANVIQLNHWIYIVKWTRPLVKILSISCSFWEIWQNRMLMSSGGGNPGSDTVNLS